VKKKTLTRYAKKFLLSETGKKLIAENIVLFFNDYFMPALIYELNETYPQLGGWKFVFTGADLRNIEITQVKEKIHLLRYEFSFTCPSTGGSIRFALQSLKYTIGVNFLLTEGFGTIEVVEKNEKGIPIAFDISMLYIMRVSVRFITYQEELRHYTPVYLGRVERDIKTCSNRTIVGLKPLLHRLPLCIFQKQQSHHCGIETTFALLPSKVRHLAAIAPLWD